MMDISSYTQVRRFYTLLNAQKENQRFLKTLEIGVTFAFIAFFMVLAVRPTVIVISSLIGEIRSKEELTQKLQSKINNVIRAQDEYAQVQDHYELIDSALPDRPKYFQAASHLSGAAQASNLNLSRLSFSLNSQNKKNLSSDTDSYSINYSTNNSYDSTVSLLKKILNSRRFLGVKDINFSIPRETAEGLSGIDFSVSLDLYYFQKLNETK